MIKIQNLHKSYGSTEILKGIDVELKDGEVLAIIGPSGSKIYVFTVLKFFGKARKGYYSDW